MEAVFALPHEYTFLNYLRCHDDIGWGLDYDFLKMYGMQEVAHKKYLNDYLTGKGYNSDARGELYNDDPRLGDARLCGTTASLCGIEAAEYEQDAAKLDRSIRFDIMLHAFLFTQSGIPVLYSGDEIGQKNDYTYHEDPLKWDDSRYLHRGKLNWEEVAQRGDMNTRPGRIFNALRVLETIRAEHEVFDNEADTWIVEPYNDHILGIGRYYKGEKLIALFNFSAFDETAWINEDDDYIDLITGQPRLAKAVGIPAYDFAWLLTDFNKPVAKRQSDVMAKMGEKLTQLQEEAAEAPEAPAPAEEKPEENLEAAPAPAEEKPEEKVEVAPAPAEAVEAPAPAEPAPAPAEAAETPAPAEPAPAPAEAAETPAPAEPAPAPAEAAEAPEEPVKKPAAKKKTAKKTAAKKKTADQPAAKDAEKATDKPAEKKAEKKTPAAEEAPADAKKTPVAKKTTTVKKSTAKKTTTKKTPAPPEKITTVRRTGAKKGNQA
jgi:amylosucrase